ncbi:hypothetical protein I4F81_010764 [Pyropia yezoensis]|uniref:Uncharacterized protein n=1 Tax=Pyropia yezoensis TaxID=2788 RepID=A0ACC3CE46_PYRYE|nr:hypothetical protein I4F81_010764 [Neopyropia yezoensis]
MGAKGVLNVVVPLAIAAAASFLLYVKTEVVLAETRTDAKATDKDVAATADATADAAVAAVDEAQAAPISPSSVAVAAVLLGL